MINLPPNSASIIISPPLSGKKEFIYQLLQESLKNKEPVIFLSKDNSIIDNKKDLMKNKIFYGAAGNTLRFIDCYSQQTGIPAQETPDTKIVSGPIALNEISIALSQLETEFHTIKPTHKIIFDSLSTTLMYSNPQMVGRFLQILIAKIRQAGGTILFTLEEGMNEPKDTITIEHLMQAILHIRKEKGKILLKAFGIEGFEDWKELD